MANPGIALGDPVAGAYYTIFLADYSVTGIRSNTANDSQVVITGSYQSGGQPQGFIYVGPIPPSTPAGQYIRPTVPGAISSIFYGPDTQFFNPVSIKPGELRVVGSCKYATGGAYDHGLLYDGGTDGEGIWTIIDMPRDVAQPPQGVNVANTILHSTMGNLIVGNYDLTSNAGQGKFNAFIYNMATREFQKLDIGVFVTAYGIWQHIRGGTSYTIAGGMDTGNGINVAYLVNYDSETGTIGNPVPFTYSKEANLVTHFEGITAYSNGYSLAATGDQDVAKRGAAYATVDSSFGNIVWTRVHNPQNQSSGFSTGNTVLANNLFGIYYFDNAMRSYRATIVPAP